MLLYTVPFAVSPTVEGQIKLGRWAPRPSLPPPCPWSSPRVSIYVSRRSFIPHLDTDGIDACDRDAAAALRSALSASLQPTPGPPFAARCPGAGSRGKEPGLARGETIGSCVLSELCKLGHAEEVMGAACGGLTPVQEAGVRQNAWGTVNTIV